MITVAIFNESTVVPDATLLPIVAALQKQVSGDFAAAWGIDAKLTFVGKGGTPDPAAWQLGIFDNSDQAGALGYHDVTAAGQPLGKVFAKTDLDNGSSLSVTISHELLEMLADPDISRVVYVEEESGGTLYAYEDCDACEDDSFGYLIDGVLVSDFVYPAWFESFRTSGPFDKQGKITSPFELLPGGYIGTYKIPNTDGWTQLYADSAKPGEGFAAISRRRYLARPRVGSRRERRRIPRSHWLRSTK